MAELPALSTSMTFDTAASAVLSYLRSHVPMGFWSVTRLENGRQTYLYLDDDNAYDAAAGDSHAWEGSLCVRMLAGDGPRVAPDVAKVPAYRHAPVSRSMTIGSYAAVPIVESDGAVFGTICGLNREPRGDEMLAVQPLLELLASLLNMVLAADRHRDAALRLASAHTLAAETDTLRTCTEIT